MRVLAIPEPYTNKQHSSVTSRTLVLDCTAPTRSSGYTLSTSKVVWVSSNLIILAGGGVDVGEYGEEKRGGKGGNGER